MMESNPGEAVKNNVLGTAVIADAAAEYATAAMVLVSTDKAVNPTSVMGASKRCAELYVQGMSGHSQTRFLSVRFGNVIGSSGSVVPIFKRQIAAGGPVTITHADMRRYFMTIPEAAQLVMQAGAIGRGGEIFLLDMGEPVKIIDLARAMISRAGLVEGRDIDIEVTGIRPGEKLFEELACDNEVAVTTSHPKISIWRLPPASEAQARLMLTRLSEVTGSPRSAVVSAIQAFVPEFTPDQATPDAPRSATQMRIHRPAA
jgi:FlaA1/EpsC-like NDP-sugar epimerase